MRRGCGACLIAPAHLATEAGRLEQRQQAEPPGEWMLGTELVAEGTGYAGVVGSKLERQPQRRGLMVDAVRVHAASLRPVRPDGNGEEPLTRPLTRPVAALAHARPCRIHAAGARRGA